MDPKGDLHRQTAAHRERANNRIVLLDPFGRRSQGFNRIAALEIGDEFADDALSLAEAVIRLEGKEPHWSQAAQEWVAALIMWVRLVIPNGSFEDVRALLGLPHAGIRSLVRGGHDLDPRQYELFERGEAEESYNPPFRYKGRLYPGMISAGIRYEWEEIGIKAARFGDITPDNREILSVLSTGLTQTRWLDSRPIKRDLASSNPIDFKELKNRPTTVYLILPARRLATHSTWMRLIIASIIQALMRDTTVARVPVLLMLDEFPALAGGINADAGDGFPAIANNMAMFRGYGIKLWTVWQDLAQAKRIYGEGFESFLSNAGVVQSFAAQDLVTAQYLSDRTGQTTRQLPSRSQSRQFTPGQPGGQSVTESTSIGYIPMPPMLPQEVRNMDDGFTIVQSHRAKGTVRLYLPDPSQLPHVRHLVT